MVIMTDGVKVIIVNIMVHVKVYFMNKQNVFVLNYSIKMNINVQIMLHVLIIMVVTNVKRQCRENYFGFHCEQKHAYSFRIVTMLQ